MDYTLRKFTADDIDAMGELKSVNTAETYDDRYIDYRWIESLTPEHCKDFLRTYTSGIGSFTYVAEGSDGRLLGYATGRPSPDVMGAYWLEYMDVAEEARGMGVGKALIFETGRRAKREGYPQMVIDVLAGNDKAEGIYRHLGAELLDTNFIQDLDGFLLKSKLLVWEDLDVFEE